MTSSKCHIGSVSPPAPLTGLQSCLIVIIERFLVHLDQLLPLDFAADHLMFQKRVWFMLDQKISIWTHLVEVLRGGWHGSSLRLWKLVLRVKWIADNLSVWQGECPYLLILPLLGAARDMDPDAPGAEVSAANVASHRGHPDHRMRITVHSPQIDFNRVEWNLISLKLAHTFAVSQVEICSEIASNFSAEVETLALRAREPQLRHKFHELMITIIGIYIDFHKLWKSHIIIS